MRLELLLAEARGSTRMPPLPPPKGTSAMAVFQVISAASALKRSSETSWW